MRACFLPVLRSMRMSSPPGRCSLGPISFQSTSGTKIVGAPAASMLPALCTAGDASGAGEVVAIVDGMTSSAPAPTARSSSAVPQTTEPVFLPAMLCSACAQTGASGRQGCHVSGPPPPDPARTFGGAAADTAAFGKLHAKSARRRSQRVGVPRVAHPPQRAAAALSAMGCIATAQPARSEFSLAHSCLHALRTLEDQAVARLLSGQAVPTRRSKPPPRGPAYQRTLKRRRGHRAPGRQPGQFRERWPVLCCTRVLSIQRADEPE
jgi:hypothetical protein